MKGTVLIFLALIFVLIICGKVSKESFCGKCPFEENYIDGWMKGEDEKKILEKISSLPQRLVSNKKQDIPLIIHQTHNSEYIPSRMKKAIGSILLNNPEYQYRYYDNKKARKIINLYFDENTLKAYDSLIPGAYKADLFRYCLLYLYGGVYVDTGFVSLRPLKEVIKRNDRFISIKDLKEGDIYNAFICSVPKHPIIKRAIEISVERVLRKDYGDSPLYITGPSVLGKAFSEVTKNKVEEGEFNDEIVLGKYEKELICISGIVKIRNKKVFYNKYPGYRSDSKWYCKEKRYNILWDEGKVFNE